MEFVRAAIGLSSRFVIPAKAGIHLAFFFAEALWIPAFAGMTVGW